MYLVRSSDRWVFQRRVPQDLVHALGTSPIRIFLPQRSALDARQFATRLSAVADISFAKLRAGGQLRDDEEGGDPRDEMIAILRATLDEADKLLAMGERELEIVKKRAELQHAVDRITASQKAQAEAERINALISAIAPHIHEAVEELKLYRDKYGPLNRPAASLDAIQAMLASMNQKVATIDDRTERAENKPLDLLSVGLSTFLDKKRPELSRNGRESKYTSHTVPNAVGAFVEFAGDRPANRYQASDFNDFMTFLARVPVNWRKKPQFRKLNLREAVDKNAKLRPPLEMLSGATIVRSYMTPLRGVVEWLCQNEERSPFDRVRVVAPRQAKPSDEREPLTLAQVNKLLETTAVAARRPEDYWLPLLGFLTGARIGELAGIRGEDVKRLKEHFSPEGLLMLEPEDRPDSDPWLLDISTDYLFEDQFKLREVKNYGSRRWMVVHPVLEELGFVAWARAQRGYIFKELHAAENPADAASKRMARLFEKAGIRTGQARQDVFHSLRHTAKDWLRGAGVPERTTDRQAGHRPEGEGGKYGAKRLTPVELCVLSAARLPTRLDLSSYRSVGPEWSPKLLRKRRVGSE